MEVYGIDEGWQGGTSFGVRAKRIVRGSHHEVPSLEPLTCVSRPPGACTATMGAGEA